jgi:1-deoxy-D-xylulose-5-phosphate synthase
MEEITIGTGRRLRTGGDLAILTIGHVGNHAETACARLAEKGIEVGLYDMRFVKPLDEELLHEVFSIYSRVVTVEDGCIQGGFGSAILEFMADHQYHADVKRLGIPDAVVEHGEQSELQREAGFDVEGIESTVVAMVNSATRVR